MMMMMMILLISSKSVKRISLILSGKQEKKNLTNWLSLCFVPEHTQMLAFSEPTHQTPMLCVQLSVHTIHLAVVVLSWPNLPTPDTVKGLLSLVDQDFRNKAATVRTDLGLCQQSQEARAHKTWVTENDTRSNKHSSNCGGKHFLPPGCQPLSKLIPEGLFSFV